MQSYEQLHSTKLVNSFIYLFIYLFIYNEYFDWIKTFKNKRHFKLSGNIKCRRENWFLLNE